MLKNRLNSGMAVNIEKFSKRRLCHIAWAFAKRDVYCKGVVWQWKGSVEGSGEVILHGCYLQRPFATQRRILCNDVCTLSAMVHFAAIVATAVTV